jgi:cellulose synthase (UDP-forming)
MSYSKFMADRFNRHQGIRMAVVAVYVFSMLVYLGWRLTILNENSMPLSLVYYGAEWLGFILGLTLIFCSWSYRHRDIIPAPKGLSVDVFIPTYKEPVELVRLTVIAAKEIRYPHQTFVLDDGNRPEMKALAEELEVRYYAREKNLHAKAGNLNHGLKHSKADFVLVFDADHIALPNALDVMLGFFREEKVALVQSPQDYYNTDAFQYMNPGKGRGLWHDQSFFYGIAEPCRDAFNAASCSGSSVLYRRRAIDAIGGIPTDTVTEDMHTSIRLHKAGFELVFINEPVAYGVAATDIREYYRTRHRWAHGNLHVLRLEKIFTSKGLTLGQRLGYLTLGTIYFEGWQQLLLFSVPIVSLVLGMAPFEITALNVVIVLLFPIFTTLLLQELGCGLSRYWVNEIFCMVRFPIHLISWAGWFKKKMMFRTSMKNIRGRIDWLLMMPQISIALASLAALGVGVKSLIEDFKIGPLAKAFLNILSGNPSAVDWHARLDQGYTLDLVAVAGFWAFFNSAKAIFVVRKAIIDALHSADDYRFDARLAAETVDPHSRRLVRIDRISSSWVSARIYEAPLPGIGEMVPLRLHLPSGVVMAEVNVTARHPSTAVFEGALIFHQPEARDHLVRSLYSVDWHREFMHRSAFFLTPLQALSNLFLFRREERPATWSPALCMNELGDGLFAVVSEPKGRKKGSLLSFTPLPVGEDMAVDVLGTGAVEHRFLRVVGREELHTQAVRGLDGSIVSRYEIEWVESGQHRLLLPKEQMLAEEAA